MLKKVFESRWQSITFEFVFIILIWKGKKKKYVYPKMNMYRLRSYAANYIDLDEMLQNVLLKTVEHRV